MAISQFTTQQSHSVNPKHVRHLQVGYLASSARKRPPHIRILGRWVEEAGFPVGSYVSVEVSHGRLVIESLPHGKVCEPPPTTRAYISERMTMTVDRQSTHQKGSAGQGGNAS